jgi:Tfp pilus assembly protein FimT
MTARSEAVKRNRNIELVAATGGWQNGWRIENPLAGEPDILNHVQPGANDIVISDPGVTIGFQASGRSEGEAKFQITVGGGKAIAKRCVTLKMDGRAESVDGDCS